MGFIRKFRTRLHKRGKKGAISLEMMGVIAVLGLIAAGSIYYISMMLRDTKVNSTVEALQLINTKVNEMYLNEPSFSGLTSEIFAKSGNASANILNGDKTGLRSPWGTITIDPVSSDSTDDTFKITLSRLPQDVCQKLSSTVMSGSSWQSIKVGAATWDADDDGSGLVNFLFTNCAEGNNNTVELQARKQ